MERILLLEDEAVLRHSLCRLLRQEGDLTVRDAGSLKSALVLLDERPNLIVSDLDLPDGSGVELLQELPVRGLNVPVIIITGYLSRFRSALPTISNVDILEKPLDSERFMALVRERLSVRGTAAARPAFTVADYLQLAGLARRNVRLTIVGDRGAQGKIVVQNGQAIWAEDQLGEGLAAFRRLALLPRADVECKADNVAIVAPNVEGSLEQLLLDTMRTEDERQRSFASEAPARTSDLDSLLPIMREEQEPVSEVATAAASARRRPSSALSSVQRPEPPQLPRFPPRPALSAVAPESSNGASKGAAPMTSESVQKEKPMTMMKPLKPVTSIDKLVTQQNSLTGVARARKDGSVVEVAGEIDAETTCAVVTVASRHIEDLAADLGLGDVSSWHLSLGKSTWYVANSSDDMVVAFGGPNKSPTSTLSKVEESVRRRS